jgi:hypothetical protein
VRLFAVILLLVLAGSVPAQFKGFENKGLVGVGRISPAQLDKAGNGTNDSLGGFSALVVDQYSLVQDRGRISGTLFGLPDRGFGDGSADYHPRIQVYGFTITPYYGSAPTGQNQIRFTNNQTILLTYDSGIPFTGFDAGSDGATFPQAAANSTGRGRRALDPEGLARLKDGSWWISDEYGPALFHFSPEGLFMDMIMTPPAFQPFQSGKLNFTAVTLPHSGRRNNRGLEGLTLTPDGKSLVAFLQSPLVQDGGGDDASRNTRLLQIHIVPGSATYGRTAEYVYQLAVIQKGQTNMQTLVSEVLAVGGSTFLALERDVFGRGAGTNRPIHKKIVLFSTEGASNIAGSDYDMQKGSPGHIGLPATDLPPSIKPVKRQDFIDLLDARQLAKYGLSAITNPQEDINALTDKWEALGLIPLADPQFPNDHLLLVGNDNDFKAPLVFHNGQIIATNAVSPDIMLLAYRVTLPEKSKTETRN